jgi:hypothetical protein
MPDLGDEFLRWLRSPRWVRVLQDPRARLAVIRALRLRARVGSAMDARIEKLAGRLNLATQREIRELKRSLRRLERELETSRSTQPDQGEAHRHPE